MIIIVMLSWPREAQDRWSPVLRTRRIRCCSSGCFSIVSSHPRWPNMLYRHSRRGGTISPHRREPSPDSSELPVHISKLLERHFFTLLGESRAIAPATNNTCPILSVEARNRPEVAEALYKGFDIVVSRKSHYYRETKLSESDQPRELYMRAMSEQVRKDLHGKPARGSRISTVPSSRRIMA